MSREDIEKLLGGYASGTLTPAEERVLFAAALEDQQLFDALQREQPLREVLHDPAARATLLAALDDRPAPWYRRLAPRAALALAGVACLLISIAVWNVRHRPARPVLVADTRSAPIEPALPAAEPAPAPPAVVRQVPPAPRARSKALPKTPVPSEPAKAKPAEPRPFERTPVLEPRPGATIQTVEVTAAPAVLGPLGGVAAANGLLPAAPPPVAAPPAAPAPAPAARAIPRSQAAFALMQAAGMVAPPVTWTVLRREPDGQFAAANPTALETVDTIKLRLESRTAGYVYVSERDKLLASGPVAPGKPFEAPIESQASGRRDLDVRFSPRPIVWDAAVKKDAQALRDSNDLPVPPRPPSLTITLQYK
jgi:hypothetical protein